MSSPIDTRVAKFRAFSDDVQPVYLVIRPGVVTVDNRDNTEGVEVAPKVFPDGKGMREQLYVSKKACG
jgi:hypothetical protein